MLGERSVHILSLFWTERSWPRSETFLEAEDLAKTYEQRPWRSNSAMTCCSPIGVLVDRKTAC